MKAQPMLERRNIRQNEQKQNENYRMNLLTTSGLSEDSDLCNLGPNTHGNGSDCLLPSSVPELQLESELLALRGDLPQSGPKGPQGVRRMEGQALSSSPRTRTTWNLHWLTKTQKSKVDN